MRVRPFRSRPLRAVFWIGSHTDVLIRRLETMRVVMLARFTLIPNAEHPRYMIFETNWSGAEQSYIPDFGALMPVQWMSIFGNVKGFRGPLPTTGLVEYVEQVDWGVDHYWSDYGKDASTQTVLGSLELQERFVRFERDTLGLPPDLFAERWRRFTTEMQKVLEA
jgi:hypothetical protein